MAEEGAQEVQAEADVPLATPALSITRSGLEIYDCWTARILVGVVSVGAAAFWLRNPKIVEKALNLALNVWAPITSIRPGSILVELSFESKDNYLKFIDDFEQGRVKDKMETELIKIGFKEDFEVILKDKGDVYKIVNEIRQERGMEKVKSEDSVSEPDAGSTLLENNNSNGNVAVEQEKTTGRKRKAEEKMTTELNKIGFKEAVEVIPRDKEDVYKTVNEIRQERGMGKVKTADSVEDVDEDRSTGKGRKMCEKKSPVNSNDDQYQPKATTKRIASETPDSNLPTHSQSKRRKGPDNTRPVETIDGKHKPETSTEKTASEVSGVPSPNRVGEIVFAIDSSSDVTEMEFSKQIDFVQLLKERLNMTVGALIAYGDSAETLIQPSEDFSAKCKELQKKKKPSLSSGSRRMDLALLNAKKEFSLQNGAGNVKNFDEERERYLVLITFGEQAWESVGEETSSVLSSAAESLQEESVKIVVIAVGDAVRFPELVNLIERSHQLFWLLSFSDRAKVEIIAEEIKKTSDIVTNTMQKAEVFDDYDPGWGLGEKIIESLDVLEGALNKVCWTKKPKRGGHEKNVTIVGKARKRIYESLNDFHKSAILDSNLTVTIAAFGTEGVGKSSLLNFLLTQGVPQGNPNNLFSRLRDGPLPSGEGVRQTSLPVFVKNAKSVRVLIHKEGKAEVCFPELGCDDRERNALPIVQSIGLVRDCIKCNFPNWMEEEVSYLELEGPFPIFQDLGVRKTTYRCHLELSVDVQLVDLPGLRGEEKGDKILTTELNKADIILFFTSGQQGREVTSHDLANIFRQHGKFDALSRPRLVHVVKAKESDEVERLLRENRKALEDAWSVFFGDDKSNECFRAAWEKLPQLGGEELLKQLKDESVVLVFHPQDKSFVKNLKEVISSHVENVTIKKSFHPSLKKVHKLAKELKKVIPQSGAKAKEPQEIKLLYSPPLEISSYDKDEEGVIGLFLRSEDFTQQDNLPEVFKGFLHKIETIQFVKQRLEVSLLDFIERVITLVEEYWNSKSMSITSGFKELVNVFCQGKIDHFCAHRSETIYFSIAKNCKPTKAQQKKWQTSTNEMRDTMLRQLLEALIDKVLTSFLRVRGKKADSTPLNVSDSLMVRIQDLFAITFLNNVDVISKIALKKVIDFSREAIRKYNPHFDLSSLDSYDHTKAFPEEMRMRSQDKLKITTESSHKNIVGELLSSSGKVDLVQELEKKLKLEKRSLDPPKRKQEVDKEKWVSALLTVLCDQDHFDVPLDDRFKLNDESERESLLLKSAKKRLFAFQKSRVKCDIVEKNSIPEGEIHVEKQGQFQNFLAASMTTTTRKLLEKFNKSFTNCQVQLAPIFIPTIRPGPQPLRTGNYFLQENPWDVSEEETPKEEKSEGKLEFNIFLVVEKRHLKTIKSTVAKKTLPSDRVIKLTYVVLPGNRRGIGVARAVIKSLAECFKFDLYWTIDDDIKFMYQFNEDNRKWLKCTFGRGLLFGQRVFHHCRQTTFKQPSEETVWVLRDEIEELWPEWAKKSKTFREAKRLLFDENLKKIRDSPGLLDSPFTSENVSIDCEGQEERKGELKGTQKEFVKKCRTLLFDEAINHIAGVSIAHKASQRYDFMGVHPNAHFMPSKQRYQVVLHNTCALREVNYVTDDMIFHEDEGQVEDANCRNTPYWGIRHSDKSFCRALEVKGITGFQVICVNHEHNNKLVNAFERIGRSYEDSSSSYGSELEEP